MKKKINLYVQDTPQHEYKQKIVRVEDGCGNFFRNICVRFYQKLQAVVAYIQHYECCNRESVDWIDLDQDGHERWAAVNTY